MKLILVKILKNIGTTLIARPMIFWGARLAAKSTDNLIDDNVINVLENAYDSDINKLEASLKTTLSEIQKELKDE